MSRRFKLWLRRLVIDSDTRLMRLDPHVGGPTYQDAERLAIRRFESNVAQNIAKRAKP